jgi:hypothetical protein
VPESIVRHRYRSTIHKVTGAFMPNENVVEFPTGRLLASSANDRDTVAILVRKLAAGARLSPRPSPGPPISIDLRDLTGICDPTIDRLAALAGAKALTPASAARLAMRHAQETGSASYRTHREGTSYSRRHELLIAGDAFDRFAFRVEDRSDGAWVAVAALVDLRLLFSVCQGGGQPFYLVAGLDAKARPITILRRPRDWRTDLTRLAATIEENSQRHVLVVGGLPQGSLGRAIVIAGIEDGLERRGMRVRSGRTSARASIATGDERERQARRHLILIEIALPGLVDVQGSRL